jgi:aspartate carbamoyltransferase catalytic subunit
VSGEKRHVLSVADLGRDGIDELMRLTESFVEVSERKIPKVPTLRGKTVVSLF